MKEDWKLASACITDKSAALAEMTFALGSLIGPIVGGKLADSYGYISMCNICCIASFVVTVFNFMICFVPDFFKKEQAKIEVEED